MESDGAYVPCRQRTVGFRITDMRVLSQFV